MSNSRQSDVVPPPPHQRILLVLIIVISRMLAQDGGVQFIKTKEAVVTKIWSPPCHGYEPFVRACSVSYYLFMLFVAWTPGGKNESKASSRTNQVLVIQTIGPFLYAHHVTGSITGYRTVKRLGIPDSNIILMLADDVSCNARNKFPATVYSNNRRSLDLYGENIEVDYRGYEVTVENFLRLLTGRVDPSVPRSKRLLTDERSNIFVYMTGHGGAEFLKFQDNEEISAFDIADAFEQMWQKKRYHEIFFMIDTCQANTMYSKFYSPNILATGSSEIGESSYSYVNDADIGVAVIDRYTHLVLSFLEGINKTSQATMQELRQFDAYDFNHMRSHAGIRTDLFARNPSEVLLTDFFGGVTQTEVVDLTTELSLTSDIASVSETNGTRMQPSSVRSFDHQWEKVERQAHLQAWQGWVGSMALCIMLVIGYLSFN
ncbi:probable GPI8-GPI-anchor transamidase [Serendipita indica DSM 11827]|uniref:Probable GPI8-GPI-anchor transamidase n=1 Tax=Serendipita indica (strain DSM 11827) TaxID=1109443 RepID=G4T7L1_SERID|nr:probable GPI8-GPI-anchor transamidase [Serendipita indica DSM 11827]